MSETGKYWRQVERFQDVRVGLRAKVRLGIDSNSTREGLVTHVTKAHIIIELDAHQGEISLTKHMLNALQTWYDIDAEKKRNDEIERKKQEAKRPSISPVLAVSQGLSPQLDEFDEEDL